MIRTVVFDFDGTLVLSNALKREGFFVVAADFPNGIAVMSEIMHAPPGDRFAICASFAARCGGTPEELAERYSAWCESAILACPERAGATAILTTLRQRGIRAHINSATPQAPLRQIVERRYLPGTFAGVFGGHDAKVANLKTILSLDTITPDEILMVGDGIDDRDAARSIGCAFAGVDEGSLAASDPDAAQIADLTALENLLTGSGQ